MSPEQVASYIAAFGFGSIITVFIKNWLDNKKIKKQRIHDLEKEFLYKKEEAFIIIDNYMSEVRNYILKLKDRINLNIFNLDKHSETNFTDKEKIPGLIKLYFKNNEDKYLSFLQNYNHFLDKYFEDIVKEQFSSQELSRLIEKSMLSYNDFQIGQEEDLQNTKNNLYK